MHVVVLGAGAVGARAARQLASTDGVLGITVADTDRDRAATVAAAMDGKAAAADWSADLLGDADVLVLAGPSQPQAEHRRRAEEALERGAHVVSLADSVDTVRALLQLDPEARERALSVVVGAGFSPGLSCVLARHAAMSFSSVDEIHVATTGTGGPACARQHHRALTGAAVDWRDGAWVNRRGGSGRELAWFPDPVGALDCYRASLPHSLLLVPGFPGVARVTARLAASRRDRVTAHFPMVRRPHPEGLLGATRVEVRGRRGATHDVRVMGVLDRPAVAAGAVACVAAVWAAEGRFARLGAAGLAELVADTVPFLTDLGRRGVRAAVFEGVR